MSCGTGMISSEENSESDESSGSGKQAKCPGDSGSCTKGAGGSRKQAKGPGGSGSKGKRSGGRGGAKHRTTCCRLRIQDERARKLLHAREHDEWMQYLQEVIVRGTERNRAKVHDFAFAHSDIAIQLIHHAIAHGDATTVIAVVCFVGDAVCSAIDEANQDLQIRPKLSQIDAQAQALCTKLLFTSGSDETHASKCATADVADGAGTADDIAGCGNGGGGGTRPGAKGDG